MGALECLAAGMAAGCAIPFALASWPWSLALLCLWILTRTSVLPLRWPTVVPKAIVLFAAAMPLAGLWSQLRAPRMGPGDIAREAPLRVARVEGIVASDPVLVDGAWHFILRADAMRFPEQHPADGLLAAKLDAVGRSAALDGTALANASRPQRLRPQVQY
ncbi:MAG: DUF4131 domain-containing protein, partial [Cyanobacteria bacterium REEB65]|nr:DUF4131 domain-containing protein [Cyanobacteria bacterium REEB65]